VTGDWFATLDQMVRDFGIANHVGNTIHGGEGGSGGSIPTTATIVIPEQTVVIPGQTVVGQLS